MSTYPTRLVLIAAVALGLGCSSEQLGSRGGGTGGGAIAGSGGTGAGGTVLGAGGVSGGPGGSDAGGLDSGCRQSTDCQRDLICTPAGVPVCGICSPVVSPCSADSDCVGDAGTPMVCDQLTCACDMQCHPGCAVDGDCGPGFVCGADHRCAAAPCGDGGADCPADFACGVDGHCARRSCSSAAECSSACVQGLCYDQPGYCAPLLI